MAGNGKSGVSGQIRAFISEETFCLNLNILKGKWESKLVLMIRILL